jgi:hypothetical protein
MKNQPKLDSLLLGIGAMKAGTTWLYRQLEQHPGIVFSREKELHYLAYSDGDQQSLSFNYRLSRMKNALRRGNINPRIKGLADLAWYFDYLFGKKTRSWYRRRFGSLSAGQYAADFSNLSATLGATGWGEAVHCTDKLRIIYILRHPLQRIWSQLVFQQAATPAGAAAMTAEAIDSNLRSTVLKHSCYASNLEQLSLQVPAEQQLILIFEEVHADPLRTLRQIEHFLELAPHDYSREKLDRKINASSSPPMPAWLSNEFAEDCNRELERLAHLGIRVPENWYCRA